jgi:hypothetical protein
VIGAAEAAERWHRIMRLKGVMIALLLCGAGLLLASVLVGAVEAYADRAVPFAMALFAIVAAWKLMEFRAFVAMRVAQGHSAADARSEWRAENPGTE